MFILEFITAVLVLLLLYRCIDHDKRVEKLEKEVRSFIRDARSEKLKGIISYGVPIEDGGTINDIQGE